MWVQRCCSNTPSHTLQPRFPPASRSGPLFSSYSLPFTQFLCQDFFILILYFIFESDLMIGMCSDNHEFRFCLIFTLRRWFYCADKAPSGDNLLGNSRFNRWLVRCFTWISISLHNFLSGQFSCHCRSEFERDSRIWIVVFMFSVSGFKIFDYS